MGFSQPIIHKVARLYLEVKNPRPKMMDGEKQSRGRGIGGIMTSAFATSHSAKSVLYPWRMTRRYRGESGAGPDCEGRDNGIMDCLASLSQG